MVLGGSVPDLTFQVRPIPGECNPRIPQTPHAGMVTAFADGSVRTLSRSISPAAFWGAVTPSAGEVLNDG